MTNQNSKSFTLIELLIVLAIIAILATVLILTIKPGAIFSRARDTQRINDLKNIERIIDILYSTEYTFNELNYASTNVVYISLPDSSSTCGSWLSQLPSLPSGWSYHCSATPTNIDGTGWIPIPFSNFPILNISQLFIDPINKPPYYYSFVIEEGYEVTALLERNNQEFIVSNSQTGLTPVSRGRSTDYSYRRQITINNTSNSNNLTDYQVLVTLDTQSLISAGKMRSDCGDIKFTDSDGQTLLNYWLESGCNTTNTRIWVKVLSIPANSTKTIYVYYGNLGATSASKMWDNIKHLNIYGGVFNYNANLGVNGYHSREMQHRLGVAAGQYHTCVLKSNGNVDCYGNNSYGQANDYTLGDAIGVAAGQYHTCVLKSNGNVDCYGNNSYGQANDYTLGDAIGVAAESFHTCVLKSNGNVDCYGYNGYGQANDYTLGDAIGVAAGVSHTCVLKSNGNVDCYGSNDFGQANDYTLGDAIGVAAGSFHTCVLKSNGNVDCYGDNFYGQANDYTLGDAIGVAAGASYTCVLKSNGNVDCYGRNDFGQANDYTLGDAKNPFRKYTSPEPTISVGSEERL
jgi:prepilin-type N-terminal cleavage/methylation domain-containing protein